MKKGTLIVLCLALAVVLIGGGLAAMYLSPRGVLHPALPQQVMQRMMDSRSRDDWREEFIRAEAPAVTEFEDAAAVAGRLFDAATEGAPLEFREEYTQDPDREAVFHIYAGRAALFRCVFHCENGIWTPGPLESLHTISAENRTVTIQTPSDARVTVNGRAVSAAYVTDPDVMYDAITDRELRFPACPHAVRYEIPGVWEDVRVEAVRDNGVILLSADGSHFDFYPADGGSYTFTAQAPQDAVLTLGGADFTVADAAATIPYPTQMSVPEALQPYLPDECVYSFGGLFTRELNPELVYRGQVLSPETGEDGRLIYRAPLDASLHDACHDRVADFLRNVCYFGAGNTGSSNPSWMIARDAPLSSFFNNALGSLYWVHGITVDIHEIVTQDYLPLGDDAFLCHGVVRATKNSYFQHVDLHLGYEMLWLRQADGSWRIWDMAYEEPVS